MTGYCKYCDSLIDDEDMIRAYNDDAVLVWTGCLPCYQKRLDLMEKERVRVDSSKTFEQAHAEAVERVKIG